MTILQATLARFANDVQHTLALSQQALHYLPPDDSILNSINTLNLGHAYRLEGNNEAASEAFKQTITTGRAIGNTYTVLLALNTMIQLQIEHGTLRSAEHYCQESLKFAARHNCQQLPIMSQTYVKEGELLYQRNRLEEAAQRLEEGIRLGQNKGGLRFLLEGYILQARVLHAQGEGERALEVLAHATEVARENASSWLILQIAAQQTRIMLAQGQLAPAFVWLEQCALRVDDTPTYMHEFAYLTLARLVMAQGKVKEVVGLLERLRQSALNGKRNGVVIEILLLQALANYAQNQPTEAFIALERAFLLAEPEGYLRLFVDEGRRVAQLLPKFLEWQEQSRGRSSTTRSLQSYVYKLLDAYTHTDSSAAASSQKEVDKARRQEQYPLLEKLGERETEVLHYLAAGLSNAAIAKEMVVALSTVKSHLKSIYRKLDVESRTHAIAKARELHLL